MERWQHIREDIQYAVYLWILHLSDCNILKMIYGLASPIGGEFPRNRWFISTVDQNQDIQADIIRLNCYITGKELKAFADMLFMGKSLDNISKGLGIESIREDYKDLALIKEHYRQRPAIFLETRETISYYNKISSPIASFADNSMICESIVDIDKENLFQKDERINLLLMGMVKNALIKEMSMQIPGPDAERLGNFEIFSFPHQGKDDTSPIKIEVIKEGEKHLKVRIVKISIKPDKFEGNIYLRCRLRNGNVVIGDHVKLIQNDKTTQDTLFYIEESCSGIEVTVWDADADPKKPIALLYEQRVSIMRTMHLTTEIMGLQGRLETQWTKRLAVRSNGTSIHNEFERNSRSYSEVGGYKDDPWVPAARAITKLFNEKFPDKSNAQFFSKGWQDEDRFVRWLQGIVGRDKIHRVVLIDPYFDDEAVSKFIALANYNDVFYEVITDVGFRGGATEQIVETCKECKLIMPHDVKIYGLSRAGSGTDQIFHDRILILFGASQLPTVYMLSNSISGVAKNFPSVVVPVPSDVAIQITEYYLAMISGITDNNLPKVNVELLWPLEAEKTTDVRKEDYKDGIKVFPGFDYLIEALSESGSVLQNQKNEDNELQINREKDERNRQFDSIGARLNRLLSEDEDKALELWCGVSNWSVRIPDSDRVEMFAWFEGSIYKEGIINAAKLCISKAVEKPYPIGVLNMEYRTESIGVAAESLASFSHLKQLSDSLIEFYFENDYPSVYSVRIAFEVLLKHHSDSAFEVLDNVMGRVNEINGRQPTTDIAPYYKVISACLSVLAYELVECVESDDLSLIKVGLGCDVTIVRAMCASAVSYSLCSHDYPCKEQSASNTMIEVVDYLKNPEERIYALSWMAYDCQVLRNRRKDNNLATVTMKYIKKMVVENWKEIGEGSLLRPILENFSGPFEGNHSEDLCNILEQLVENNIIDNQTAAEYIKDVLFEKIHNHLEGKKRYYQDVDYQFTLSMVSFITTIVPESCSSLIGEMQRIVKKAGRQVLKPFVRSRFYTEWSNSIEALCWCGIVISIYYSKSEKDLQLIEDIFNKIYLLVSPYEDDFNDNSGLLHSFLNESTTSGLLKKGRCEH